MRCQECKYAMQSLNFYSIIKYQALPHSALICTMQKPYKNIHGSYFYTKWYFELKISPHKGLSYEIVPAQFQLYRGTHKNL